MSVADVITSFVAAVNARDLDALRVLLSDDFVHHRGDAKTERESYLGLFAAFFDAVPNYRGEVVEIVASGDRGAFRGIVSGLPVGSTESHQAAMFVRSEGGHLAEIWEVRDPLPES